LEPSAATARQWSTCGCCWGAVVHLFGIMEVVLAFRLRQAGQAATRVATAT
jgi:hypothetical protein